MRTILRGVLMLLSVALCSYKLFETTVGESGCYDEGISVIPAAGGGWLVSGAYNCEGSAAAWKSYLVRLDAQGDTLSIQRDLPFNGIMKQTSDGNLIFAGGNHAGFTYDTAMIFKTTFSGELIWKKNIFGSYCAHQLTDILPLADGFLITGNYAQSSCTSPVYDCYIAKLDTNGNLLWNYDVKNAGNDQLHAVRITKDNKIAAFGWTENKTTSDDADYLLVKLDENGNELWLKTFGDNNDNFGYGMDITPDNGFILNGHSATMDVMRLDEDGKLLWSNFFTETCGGRYFKALASTDGGFVFTGSEQGANGQCTAALIKTTGSGKICWKKNFKGVLRDVIENNPGSFTLTGYQAYLPQLYVAGFDTTTLSKAERMESAETFTNSSELFSTAETPTGSETVKPESIHRAYPNPAENFVTIEFENPRHDTYHLEIFDASGKTVVNELLQTERATVNGTSMAKGLYAYRLAGGANIFYGKILFQ